MARIASLDANITLGVVRQAGNDPHAQTQLHIGLDHIAVHGLEHDAM